MGRSYKQIEQEEASEINNEIYHEDRKGGIFLRRWQQNWARTSNGLTVEGWRQWWQSSLLFI